MTCGRQRGHCVTFTKCVTERILPCRGLSSQNSPKMRAAISLLFCDGISLTTSSAVSPFWSTMFTSIPEERQTVSEWTCRDGSRSKVVWQLCLTCAEELLHHVRLPKQGCFMQSAAFLCLSTKTGNVNTNTCSGVFHFLYLSLKRKKRENGVFRR